MKPDKQRMKAAAILLLVCLAYYLETQTLGLTLGCPFHRLTGLNCPACGLTRACVHLLRGEIALALQMNLGLTLSLPVLLPFGAVCLWRWLCKKPVLTPAAKAVGIGLVVWFCLWGLVRNFMGL